MSTRAPNAPHVRAEPDRNDADRAGCARGASLSGPGRWIDACLQKGRIAAALAAAEAAGYAKRKDLPRPPQRRLSWRKRQSPPEIVARRTEAIKTRRKEYFKERAARAAPDPLAPSAEPVR